MKTRQGFVSNSSSCSFVVDLDFVSAKQLYMINYHIEYAKMKDWGFGYCGDHDWWDVVVASESIRLSTMMDNFDMRAFLDKIGVPDEAIREI